MSANWQRIGGVEVCEGTDGVVGVAFDGSRAVVVNANTYFGWCFKSDFEKEHCQPRHRLIECADGAVMVLSTDEVDGMPRRGAMASALGRPNESWCVEFPMSRSVYSTKDEAIAAAVAYVTAR